MTLIDAGGICTSPSASPVTAQVIATVEAFYAAMAAKNALALNKMLAPGAVFIRTDSRRNPPVVGTRSAVGFMRVVLESSEVLVERIWNPAVRVDGDVALLWAPYEFYKNHDFSHCGHDAIHLVRREGQWLIAALVYTMSDKQGKLDDPGDVLLKID